MPQPLPHSPGLLRRRTVTCMAGLGEVKGMANGVPVCSPPPPQAWDIALSVIGIGKCSGSEVLCFLFLSCLKNPAEQSSPSPPVGKPALPYLPPSIKKVGASMPCWHTIGLQAGACLSSFGVGWVLLPALAWAGRKHAWHSIGLFFRPLTPPLA